MTKPKLNPKRKFVRVLWTPEEEAYLRLHYPDTKTQAIADHLGRSLRKVYAKLCGMDLYKSDAFLAKERKAALQDTEQYITAEEARKLGAGKAECFTPNFGWDIIGYQHIYRDENKYRVIGIAKGWELK